ncbi:MAG: 3-dehydroquinate synthase [Candidatus Cyclobacteriaceae bacterium M2_1C_046]
MNEFIPGIFLSDDPVSGLNELITNIKYSRIVVITDVNTRKHCFPKIENIFNNILHITIPAGEEYKNIDTCSQVWEEMTRENIDRKALVINLGGGVIGDLGGFCAATYKRGIKFINVPTTLLAQVDASIGGKLGIDFQNYKNQIGVFKDPDAVFIHPGFLETLDHREIMSGYAEVVKHALISDDKLWQDIKQHSLQVEELQKLIPVAVNIKYQVVKEDPFESGRRKILNFGHTLGHAVESYLLSKGERKILHGEAVAAGMVMESWLSWQLSHINEEEFNEIVALISTLFPRISYTEEEIEKITGYLQQDKKNVMGQLKFSLLEGIGQGIYDVNVELEDCKKALKFYYKP